MGDISIGSNRTLASFVVWGQGFCDCFPKDTMFHKSNFKCSQMNLSCLSVNVIQIPSTSTFGIRVLYEEMNSDRHTKQEKRAFASPATIIRQKVNKTRDLVNAFIVILRYTHHLVQGIDHVCGCTP